MDNCSCCPSTCSPAICKCGYMMSISIEVERRAKIPLLPKCFQYQFFSLHFCSSIFFFLRHTACLLLPYKIFLFRAVHHLIQVKPTNTNTNQRCMHTAPHTCTFYSISHLKLHRLTHSTYTHICVRAQAENSVNLT